jgi:hypothetical protein
MGMDWHDFRIMILFICANSACNNLFPCLCCSRCWWIHSDPRGSHYIFCHVAVAPTLWHGCVTTDDILITHLHFMLVSHHCNQVWVRTLLCDLPTVPRLGTWQLFGVSYCLGKKTEYHSQIRYLTINFFSFCTVLVLIAPLNNQLKKVPRI